MIRNIVFDIGNVLSDFRWRGFLEDKGYDEAMIERIASATVHTPYWNEFDKGEWSDEQIMQAFVDCDPEIEAQIRNAFGDVTGMVKIRDYAVSWIRELKAKGYKVYYLSNFARKAHEQCGDSLAFIPFTDGGILSYQDKVIKPGEEIYKLLLSRYNLKAEESVFLDDTLKNVEAARALGWQGIHFKTKEQAVFELRNLGVDA